MHYSPHTLQVFRKNETRDEFNRVVSSNGQWVDVTACRCDDNSAKVVNPDNGLAFVPRYHIVANNNSEVRNGDTVRCLREDGSIRGEGRAINVRSLNKLDYMDLYAD